MFSRPAAWSVLALLLAAVVALPGSAAAHCDTLSGPVVAAAKTALDKGDVTPALKWIKASDEPELRDAFNRALTVRRLGAEARELADRFFFETAVRLHRMSEGEPYTGVKATPPEHELEVADEAIASGKLEALVALLNEQTSARLRESFGRVLERRAHAEDNVAAGRAYVEAYVAFIHQVEVLAGGVGSEPGR